MNNVHLKEKCTFFSKLASFLNTKLCKFLRHCSGEEAKTTFTSLARQELYTVNIWSHDLKSCQSANHERKLPWFSRQICSPGKKQVVISWQLFAEMSGFDERPVYFSDAFGSEEQADEREVNRISAKKRFREFIREFHEGTFSYAYRWAKWRTIACSPKVNLWAQNHALP